MIKKTTLFILILFTVFQPFSFAQQNRQLVDSLLSLLQAVKTDTIKINLLNDIAEQYNPISKDSAILYAAKAYSLGFRLNNTEQKLRSSTLLSTGYLEKGISNKALEFALLRLKIAETSGNKSYIIDANKFLSDLYTNNLNNLPKALEYGTRALSIAKETGNLHNTITNLESVSTIYFNFKKYDEALTYSIEEYKTAIILGDTITIFRALSSLGDCYRAKKNFSEALHFYNRAIAILKADSNDPNLMFTYNNMGLIYADSGDYKTAINYYLSAVKIVKRFDSPHLLSICYQNIGKACFQTKKYQEALKYNLLSIECEQTGGAVSDLKTLYLTNAVINDSLRNYKAALEALNKYIAINNDSINNEAHNKISAMEVALESEKKQKEIDIINKDKAQQKIIRNSFIAGTILLMLLIVVLINRSKLKRDIDMEKMRSRLSRDLHDDIGSTLSSINILSRTAQSNLKEASDEKTKASLEKINERSQRLLNSMSDIIWNINPGNDTVEEVMSRMREYATTLLEAKNIDYTFNFPKQQMDCRLNMEVKNNLYLIFKEAVNNLSKYSGCTHATLALIFEEKNIHLTVEDNGIGFDEPEIKHRGGLLNMQQRAAEIKGTIHIHSVINKGTWVELTMPRYC